MRGGSAEADGRRPEIIQVGQQIAPRFARGFVFSGSGESFALPSGRGKQNRTDEGGTGAIWVMQMRGGSAEADGRRPEIIQVGQLHRINQYL